LKYFTIFGFEVFPDENKLKAFKDEGNASNNIEMYRIREKMFYN
jgi:hypothetical protein